MNKKILLINMYKKKDFNKRIGYRELECKKLCDLHSEWKDLTKEEEKKYKKEKYAYKVFKNLSKDFDKYPEYYVTISKYFYEVLPRISPINRRIIGLSIDTVLSNKNYFDVNFPFVNFPNTIIRCIDGNFLDNEYNEITLEDVKEKISKYDKLVFKKCVHTSHGAGVGLVEKNDFDEKIREFGKNFIVQDLVRQHSNLRHFNESSVNIIRVITVYLDGECYVIDARFRIGAPGAFCDHLGFGDVHPLEIAVDDKGNLKGKPFDEERGMFVDDIFGKEPVGVIPGYEKMIKIAKKGQLMYPEYGLMGWDFTVDEDGEPLCMEVNLAAPFIRAAQCVSGPIFMKKTVNGVPLLDEIMKKNINYDIVKI